MQVSFLQRSQDSPLSKTEWRTNQVSTEGPRPNKQLRWPLRRLPQSASLLQLPATTLILFYRAQIPTSTNSARGYRCLQTPPPRADLRRAYVAWVQKPSVPRPSGHFNIVTRPRTGIL